MEANRETTSGACKNIMDIDIDLEPGPGGSDKNVVSKNQADSETQIPKTSSESMKVVLDNFENTSARLDIGYLAAEFPSQSDIKNYITRGHIDFLLTLPKDGKNQTFPIGIRTQSSRKYAGKPLHTSVVSIRWVSSCMIL